MTQTITDSAARPFGRAFFFRAETPAHTRTGLCPFTRAPAAGLLFPPSPPQRIKARFSDKSAAARGRGGESAPVSIPRGIAPPGETVTQDGHRCRALTGCTHNALCENTLESETYIYLFYFFFLAGTPAKNQEKNRAIVQQVFARLQLTVTQ